ncbi:MAG: methylcobamide--CoM methyltransferase MtbA [Burkholderiales bacterium]|nr:methylcobamide--CoM methyltransferase MtbA [Burkholderiales bacterium]
MSDSMQRVNLSMSHREPDRVPLFLFPTLHGAREVGLRLPEYFSKAEYMIEGQIRLLEKYRSDCVSSSAYASMELEAFGGETLFIEDGPPNAAEPVIASSDIDRLEAPQVADSPSLLKGLEVIRGLKQRLGDSVPIVATVISPFSLPIMQLGFGPYLDLLHGDREKFDRLMEINMKFCVEWANAQLDAGAAAIGYADPMSSTTNIPRSLYLETGYRIAKKVLPKIRGNVAMHLASGRGIGIAQEIAESGAQGVAVSAFEDLSEWKSSVGNKLTLIGNLNGIAMRNWSREDTEREVKKAVSSAAKGGGFILSDNHGEIPWQVPEEVLHFIRDAVDTWGNYPLEWMKT